MSSTLKAVFVLATVFLQSIQADDCSVDPLVLPIRNVTFPNGIGANRGLKLVLGGQVQGMRMSTILNNTRVRNILDCSANTTVGIIGCQGASGSVYSTTDGSFQQVFNLQDWNVTVIDAQPTDGAATVVQGYDSANFTDSAAVIPNYPLEVWADHDAMNMSGIALGPKSSTIERLVSHGLAPSSGFGLDYGSRSELRPRNGQVIFGGVNEARFDTSRKTEFPMWGAGASVNCPLQVLVSDVILTNRNGNFSLFPDPDSKVSACIDTIQNSFTLTQAMFAKFQKLGNHTESDGLKYSPSSFPADREPLLGSLTIRLANGYTSVIPHYELISHERGTDNQGKYAVVNNSRIQAAVASGQSDLGDNIPILGGVFLTENYLQVDYAAGKFWLSPSLADKNLPDQITTTCTAKNGTSIPTGNSEAGGSSNMAVKVAVPIIVACLVLGALAVWFFMRRRKKQQASSQDKGVANSPPTDSSPPPAKVGLHYPQDPDKQTSPGFEADVQTHHELEDDMNSISSPRPEKKGPYYGVHEVHSISSPRSENKALYHELHTGPDSYELADTSSMTRGKGDGELHWSPLQTQDRSLEVGEIRSPSSTKVQTAPVSSQIST